MLEITTKIPLFEGGSRLNHFDGEEIEIPLTDGRAVEMAFENMKWQAADDYFDAGFEIWINNELFFGNGTTDAYKTWCGLMDSLKEVGNHLVLFLDSAVDLNVIHHQRYYTFQYIQTDYVWGDDNYLISQSDKKITSEPLSKDIVETAIRKGFKQFATFILENNIPISKDYKQELRERLAEV